VLGINENNMFNQVIEELVDCFSQLKSIEKMCVVIFCVILIINAINNYRHKHIKCLTINGENYKVNKDSIYLIELLVFLSYFPLLLIVYKLIYSRGFLLLASFISIFSKDFKNFIYIKFGIIVKKDAEVIDVE